MRDSGHSLEATRHLTRFRQMQAVQVARTQGMAPEQISRMLRMGTGDIERLFLLLERDPGASCVRPSILVYRRWLGEITTADLMAALRIWPYTPSVYAPYPAEGMIPGSWHEVQLAYRARYLSREEFDSLRTLAPTDVTAIR